MRFTIGFCLAVAALAMLGAAAPDPADDSLRIYAVNIIQDPPQSWTGYGIYLGKGLVITAAHVVGDARRSLQLDQRGCVDGRHITLYYPGKQDSTGTSPGSAPQRYFVSNDAIFNCGSLVVFDVALTSAQVTSLTALLTGP